MNRIIPILGIIVALSALSYRVFMFISQKEPFLANDFSYILIVIGLVWTALGLGLDYN